MSCSAVVQAISDGMLRSMDLRRAIEVDTTVLYEMIDGGMLKSTVTEFDELQVNLNLQNLALSVHSVAGKGTRNPTAHLDISKANTSTKLDLMMVLSTLGWERPVPLPCEFYAPGMPEVFSADIKASRWYFACLVRSDEIFDRMPVHDEEIPMILHGKPVAYYHGLCTPKNK